MRCLMCESFSLSHICSTCKTNLLSPTLSKRKISGDIDVISFYRYEEIKKLLHTKHTDLGYYIYSILAELSFKKFAAEFDYPEVIVSIAVDDRVKDSYSHTALLNKKLQSRCIKPLFTKLQATNDVIYSGKSKKFREENPRKFALQEFQAHDVIVIDDIITTGTTLEEACKALKKAGKNVLFCLTLADATL